MGLIRKIKGIRLAYEAGKYLGKKEQELFSVYDKQGIMVVEHMDGRMWIQPHTEEIVKMMENRSKLGFLEGFAFNIGWSDNLPNLTKLGSLQ
ncbi:MAG: hypothetical protein ABSG05_01095 [Candidatus Pacearchaeota archaeon]|jgi:hypothetical protein